MGPYFPCLATWRATGACSSLGRLCWCSVYSTHLTSNCRPTDTLAERLRVQWMACAKAGRTATGCLSAHCATPVRLYAWRSRAGDSYIFPSTLLRTLGLDSLAVHPLLNRICFVQLPLFGAVCYLFVWPCDVCYASSRDASPGCSPFLLLRTPSRLLSRPSPSTL